MFKAINECMIQIAIVTELMHFVKNYSKNVNFNVFNTPFIGIF